MQDFIDTAVSLDPATVIKSYTNFKAFATDHFKPRLTPYVSQWTIDLFPFVPAEFTEWKLSQFDEPRPDRPKCLVLVGPTRCGKTALARCLGRHMYFNAMVDFRLWDDSAEYAVFDDFAFEFIPNKKCFFGGQRQFTITDKYMGKKSVTWGKPSIFLTNTPFPFDEDFYTHNCVIINLDDFFKNKPYKKLY